jgi:hypothetical protein
MLFYEISAKTGENIQTAIESIVEKALVFKQRNDFELPPPVPNSTKK